MGARKGVLFTGIHVLDQKGFGRLEVAIECRGIREGENKKSWRRVVVKSKSQFLPGQLDWPLGPPLRWTLEEILGGSSSSGRLESQGGTDAGLAWEVGIYKHPQVA